MGVGDYIDAAEGIPFTVHYLFCPALAAKVLFASDDLRHFTFEAANGPSVIGGRISSAGALVRRMYISAKISAEEEACRTGVPCKLPARSVEAMARQPSRSLLVCCRGAWITLLHARQGLLVARGGAGIPVCLPRVFTPLHPPFEVAFRDYQRLRATVVSVYVSNSRMMIDCLPSHVEGEDVSNTGSDAEGQSLVPPEGLPAVRLSVEQLVVSMQWVVAREVGAAHSLLYRHRNHFERLHGLHQLLVHHDGATFTLDQLRYGGAFQWAVERANEPESRLKLGKVLLDAGSCVRSQEKACLENGAHVVPLTQTVPPPPRKFHVESWRRPQIRSIKARSIS